jgi:hypothetical protein
MVIFACLRACKHARAYAWGRYSCQPEYASRSTALSSVWEMVSNRLSGELHEYHQMSKAGYSQHSAMKYEQETTHTDQAPTTPRPYQTASRMRCRRRQSPTSSTISSVNSIQAKMEEQRLRLHRTFAQLIHPIRSVLAKSGLYLLFALSPLAAHSPSPPSAADVVPSSAAPGIGIDFRPATTGLIKYGPN